MISHISGLIDNLALLMALCVISGFIRQCRGNKAWGAILQGALLGGAAVIGMMRPLVVGEGLIFDGRSVMISLCGLFFGPVAVAVATGMALVYRIALGGQGLLMGVLVITSSALLGLYFHYRWVRKEVPLGAGRLLGMGLLVHGVMFLCLFTLPGNALSVIRRMGLPILLIYPWVTLLIGRFLWDQAAGIRSLERLRESEAQFRSMIETSPLAIYTSVGIEQKCEYLNPTFMNLFGYSLEEIPSVAEWWPRAYPDATYRTRIAEEWNTRIQQSIDTQMPIEPVEVVVTCKDGSQKNILWGFVCTGRHQYSWGLDLTERKQLEREKADLESQNRQLQKAESLGRMAGSIAHHFNNKLQSVMMNLELLSELPPGMDLAKCLNKAKQATERTAEMSRLMLVYLGQSSGLQSPHLLSELCRGTLPLLHASLPKTVTLETELPLLGPVISASKNQVQQVLTNLMTNAWEAMEGIKGSIHLGLRVCPVAELPTSHRFPIDWQPQGTDYVCLEVRDTGCGIAETDIEKLFDPFFSTKFAGRGLGLPVVLGILRAHGAAVTVESELGQGSVFWIFFPQSLEPLPSQPETGAKALAFEVGGTILLVDDDAILLESTGILIKRMGFTLLTAPDGLEALDVFRSHQGEIRCVITDLTMPRMDGWETLAALRQLEPELPVILTSGYDKAQVLSGSQPDRPQAFLEKPYSLQQLCDALGQALHVALR